MSAGLLAEQLLGWSALIVGMLLILAVAARHKSIRTLILVAFVARAVLAVIHYYVTPLPGSQADAIRFERLATEWAQGGLLNAITHFTTGAYLYPWLISLIYTVTGRSPLMMQAINVFFGTLIIYNVYRISLSLWGEGPAKRAGWFAALFPLLILYSAITLREVVVMYPLTLGLFHIVQWYKRRSLRHPFLATIAILVSSAFHGVILLSLIVWGILLLVPLARLVKAPYQIAVYDLKVVLVIGTVLFAIIVSGWQVSKIGFFIKQWSNIQTLIQRVEEMQEVRTRGRATYPESLIVRSPVEMMWKTPLRVFYFLFTPLPWQVETPLDLLGLVRVLLNLVIAVIFVGSWRFIKREPAARALLWIAVVLLIVFALGTSNYGTATRHSAKIIPILLAVARFPRIHFG